jgi:hypothetical protein
MFLIYTPSIHILTMATITPNESLIIKHLILNYFEYQTVRYKNIENITPLELQNRKRLDSKTS